jgi:hypothetical protein
MHWCMSKVQVTVPGQSVQQHRGIVAPTTRTGSRTVVGTKEKENSGRIAWTNERKTDPSQKRGIGRGKMGNGKLESWMQTCHNAPRSGTELRSEPKTKPPQDYIGRI